MPEHHYTLERNLSHFYQTNIAFNMSVENFSLECKDKTPQSWIFGIYQNQTQAENSGLVGIAWKQVSVGPKTGVQIIPWSTTYEVCVVKKKLDENSYYPTIRIPATPGGLYEAYTDDNGATQLRSREPVDKISEVVNIEILNNVTPAKDLNLGVIMDGDIIQFNYTKPGLQSGYKVHPEFYIGCFNKVKQGDLVDGNTSFPPVQCIFPQGKFKAFVSAVVKDGKYVLEDPTFK